MTSQTKTAPDTTKALDLDALKGPIEPLIGDLPKRAFRKSSQEVDPGNSPGIVVDVHAPPTPLGEEKSRMESYREAAIKKIFTADQLQKADVRGQDLSMCTCVVGDHRELTVALLNAENTPAGLAQVVRDFGRDGKALPPHLKNMYDTVMQTTPADVVAALAAKIETDHPAFQIPRGGNIFHSMEEPKFLGDLLHDQIGENGAFVDKEQILNVLRGTYYDDKTVFHLDQAKNTAIHTALKALSEPIEKKDEIIVDVTYRGMNNFSVPLNKADAPERVARPLPNGSEFKRTKKELDPVDLAALNDDYFDAITTRKKGHDGKNEIHYHPEKEVKVTATIQQVEAKFSNDPRPERQFEDWDVALVRDDKGNPKDPVRQVQPERQTVSIRGFSSVGFDPQKGLICIVEDPADGKLKHVRLSKIDDITFHDDTPKHVRKFLEEQLQITKGVCRQLQS